MPLGPNGHILRVMAQTGGEVLREARLKKKVTQHELARRAGTTQTSIARWEADKRSPTVRQLTQLLAALDLDLELRSKVASRRGIDAALFAGAMGDAGVMRRGKRATRG